MTTFILSFNFSAQHSRTLTVVVENAESFDDAIEVCEAVYPMAYCYNCDVLTQFTIKQYGIPYVVLDKQNVNKFEWEDFDYLNESDY